MFTFSIPFFIASAVYGSTHEEKKEKASARTISPDPNYAEHRGASATSSQEGTEADKIISFKKQYPTIKTPGYFEAASVRAQSTNKEVKKFGLNNLLYIALDWGNSNAKKAAEILAQTDIPEMAQQGKNALEEIKWHEEHAVKPTAQ